MASRRQWNIAVQIKPREGAPRQARGYWQNVGRAYETDRGIQLSLNVLPIRDSAWDGGIMLFPITESQRGQPSGADHDPTEDRDPEEDDLPY